MSDLEQLIQLARRRKMTDEERRQQSVSFALGNANVEGDQLSRATVTAVALGQGWMRAESEVRHG
jgi:hypothetical protein